MELDYNIVLIVGIGLAAVGILADSYFRNQAAAKKQSSADAVVEAALKSAANKLMEVPSKVAPPPAKVEDKPTEDPKAKGEDHPEGKDEGDKHASGL